MDFEEILSTIQPFLIMFAALTAAFMTAVWVSVIIWSFRDIRARSRDVFAQILATLMVLVFFPLFPFPGLILYMLLRPRSTLSEIYERSLEEEALLQGIEERMACPGCNRRIEEQFMICPTCHTRLKKACPACGRLLHLRWNICPYCGAVQTTTKAAALLDTKPVGLAVEAPSEAPRLSEAATSRLAQPRTEPQTTVAWEEQVPPVPEEEAEAGFFEPDDAVETGSVSAPVADYDSAEAEVDLEPEPEPAAGADDDAEPGAQTLPFESD